MGVLLRRSRGGKGRFGAVALGDLGLRRGRGLSIEIDKDAVAENTNAPTDKRPDKPSRARVRQHVDGEKQQVHPRVDAKVNKERNVLQDLLDPRHQSSACQRLVHASRVTVRRLHLLSFFEHTAKEETRRSC